MNMDIEDLRGRVQAISERAREDPEYQMHVIEDPAYALEAAGLPEDVIHQVVLEWTQGGGDVEARCSWTCLGTTCEDRTTC